jgi:PAS domain-containing protein
MNAIEPLALHCSWPIYEKARHFELGSLLSCAVIDVVGPARVGELGIHHAGCWECDLTSGDALTWSGGVYDIFGLPRGVRISRDEAAALYSEESRAAMERLRNYAIRHKRGFTLDAQIRPATGGSRWMRLIAVPVIEEDRAVRLHGLKTII